MLSPGQTRLLTKVLTTRRATRWSGTSSSEQKPILSIAKRKTCLGHKVEKKTQNRFILTLAGKPTSTELDRFPLPSSSKWWSGGQNPSNKLLQCLVPALQSWNVPCLEKPDPDPITNPGPQTSSTTSESGSKCLECQIANTYQIINTWMNDKCYQISFILSSTSTLKVQRLPERPQSEACSRIPKQILGENWRQLRWGWYYWLRKAGKEWNTWRRKTIMIQMASPVKGCQV